MADIFVSYKREDELRVRPLVHALEHAGFSVWWDRALPGGESWRANIQAELEQAKCVIVAWTHASTGPAGDFVRDEASNAKARQLLVPVLLERGVRAPLGFGELQMVDLVHWTGNERDPFFRDLVEACRAKLEGRKAPSPKGPSLRSIWEGLGALVVVPAAIVFVGLCRDAFAFGHVLVRLCQRWLDFFREAWTRAFSLLPPDAPVHISTTFQDILTLWVTFAAAILLLPLLPGARLRAGTTVEALERLRLPPGIARLSALALIAASTAMLVAPFSLALSELQTSSIIMPGGESTRTWLQSQGVWLAVGLGFVSIALLLLAYFVLSPRLASVELSPLERRDLSVISLVLWAVSVATLIGSLLVPFDGAVTLGVTIAKTDLAVVSLIALTAQATWRSALPIVQLAGIVAAIFAIDVVYRTLLDIWQSVG